MHTLEQLLAADNKIILYRPEINKIVKCLSATILLSQICYWWMRNNEKPFYKFKEQCRHDKYKVGDSWCESLGFTLGELRTASDKLVELELISIEYKRLEHLTFYTLNTDKMAELYAAIYTSQVVTVEEKDEDIPQNFPIGENTDGHQRIEPSPSASAHIAYTAETTRETTTEREYAREFSKENPMEWVEYTLDNHPIAKPYLVKLLEKGIARNDVELECALRLSTYLAETPRADEGKAVSKILYALRDLLDKPQPKPQMTQQPRWTGQQSYTPQVRKTDLRMSQYPDETDEEFDARCYTREAEGDVVVSRTYAQKRASSDDPVAQMKRQLGNKFSSSSAPKMTFEQSAAVNEKRKNDMLKILDSIPN